MRCATPEWVEKAGARGCNFTVGKGVQEDGPFWEPDYEDAVFLEKLDHFLAAAAARGAGMPIPAAAPAGLGKPALHPPPPSSSTLTCTASTSSGHCWPPTTISPSRTAAWVRLITRSTTGAPAANGLTLRDDSILVQGGQNAYFNAHREFLAENRELVDGINRRLGYRLQLVEASWPAQARAESAFDFAARWRNAGTGPPAAGRPVPARGLPGGHAQG